MFIIPAAQSRSGCFFSAICVVNIATNGVGIPHRAGAGIQGADMETHQSNIEPSRPSGKPQLFSEKSQLIPGKPAWLNDQNRSKLDVSLCRFALLLMILSVLCLAGCQQNPPVNTSDNTSVGDTPVAPTPDSAPGTFTNEPATDAEPEAAPESPVEPEQIPTATPTPKPNRPRPAETSTPSVQAPRIIGLPGGRVLLGDHSGQGAADERPVREVQVGRFAISQHEITQAQYDEYLKATGHAPALAADQAQLPVVQVSWEEAYRYTQWLSKATGRTWRLPTEAEWEYAARAGLFTLYQTGNQAQLLCKAANFADLSARKQGIPGASNQCDDGYAALAPVGRFKPNGFGLFDLHGNASEWTADCYQSDAEPSASNCPQRTFRGGSFRSPAEGVRFSKRYHAKPDFKADDLGFRIVTVP
jgi:formylglycine-generating enzyme required for sulfatase activity